MKNKISNKIVFSIVLLVIALIFLFCFYQTILIGAGRYLTPEGMGKADVVVVEGTELIREEAVRIGLRLLSSERANRLVVVYQNSENEKIIGRPLNYNFFLIQELENLGLKKDQIQVLEVPKEHPITLLEAQIVLSNLSKSGVRSAILVTEGFHTRRSFWTYKKVGIPLNIKIIPYPYFINYRNETWWQQVSGVYKFVEEFLKFFYYLFRGYIPVKSLLVT